MSESIHKSVLLKETIEALNLHEDSVIIDATFGGGGHSIEILEKYPNLKIIALDQDGTVWSKAQSKLKGKEKRIRFININFRDIDKIDVDKVDGIMFDLGLSSDQLENGGRGFSFMKDEPLLMSMKSEVSKDDTTAYDIVNNWSEENIAKIIYGYGEERYSRRIAHAICEARERTEIKTTFELVRIIEGCVPKDFRKSKIHRATKTFQALRIAVNDELHTLELGLQNGFDKLKKDGRMAVISFHSLEDRIVKRYFKKLEQEGSAILINKKPITPKEEEIKNNNRARSSKLRILEKK